MDRRKFFSASVAGTAGLMVSGRAMASDSTGKIRFFNTLQDLKAAKYNQDVFAGDYVITTGYWESEDGGHGEYLIAEGHAKKLSVDQDNTELEPFDNDGTIVEAFDASFHAKLINNGSINVKQFGAKGDGYTNDTNAVHRCKNSVATGTIIYFPPGVYAGNFDFDRNSKIQGAGIEATKFIPHDIYSPVMTFRHLVIGEHLNTYNFSGYDFSIDGYVASKGNAIIGIKIGLTATDKLKSNANYINFENVNVWSCQTNIQIANCVGLNFRNVNASYATENNLEVKSNDILTTGQFDSCRFRRAKSTGLKLFGGALLEFTSCVIESNDVIGLHLNRVSDSGARQITFNGCWFENNGFLSAAGSSIACGIYIDMSVNNAMNHYNHNYSFSNCVISTGSSDNNTGEKFPDVRLVRGNQIAFNRCSFTALDSTRLSYSKGPEYAYANLVECGTINEPPSPTLYSAFPQRQSKDDGMIGFSYEYTYNGSRYKNFSDIIVE